MEDLEACKDESRHHFVLVHGVCHGAWSWQKLTALLTAGGHSVKAVDLAACGVHPTPLNDVKSVTEYAQPLMDFMASLPDGERVVLVGHSFGGISLALAMERFPAKISTAVFVTAFLPDTTHAPSYTVEQHFERLPRDIWMDSEFESYGSIEEPSISISLGHSFLSSNVYQCSPNEDLELAKASVRPGTLFLKDLAEAAKFSNEAYASIPRIYVVCTEDKLIPEFFQQWMIGNSGATEVREIHGADHMPMFSKTQELCQILLEIAKKYA